MSVDFRWISSGGVLIDGSGDIQCTDPTIPESLVDMIMTRMKADSNSWRLYTIGADLSIVKGMINDPELAMSIKRRVIGALTSDNLLSRGAFDVEVFQNVGEVTVVVYLNSVAVSIVTIDIAGSKGITVR